MIQRMLQRELSAPRSAPLVLLFLACAACGKSGEPGDAPAPAGGAALAGPTAETSAPAASPAPAAPATSPPAAPDASIGEGGELLARIDCTSDRHEFGRVWQGSVVAHEFNFTAAGEHDLKIVEYRPDCGCTVAHLEVLADDGTRTPYVLNTPVPPGTRFALAVTFDTTNREGYQAKTIKIYGNLPEGVREMSIAAEVAPMLRVEPRSQAIELMSVLERRETEFAVRGANGERFKLTPRRTGLPDQLVVETTPVAADDEGRAPTWKVRAILNPGMPKGTRSYSLDLETDLVLPDAPVDPDGKPQPFVVKALLSAVIVGHVAVTPQNLNFGMLGANETAARTVRVVCHDPNFVLPEPKVELKPLKPDQPLPLADTMRITTRRVADSNDWEVEFLLEGLSPEVGRSFLGRAVIQTGHPEEPELEVALSGLKKGS